MDSKGIFNIEMIISLIILLIIFTYISSITMTEFSSIDETENRKESRIITNDIKEIIIQVHQAGNGYSIKYHLPPKINKETYILIINDTGVFVNSHYQLTYSKILPNIIKQKQYYLEPGNIYEFTNNNDTVEIIQDN